MTEPKKKLYETPIGSFVRMFLHGFNPRMPILVCKPCLLHDDEVLCPAGDFSVCDRCKESITSKTGFTIQRSS